MYEEGIMAWSSVQFLIVYYMFGNLSEHLEIFGRSLGKTHFQIKLN